MPSKETIDHARLGQGISQLEFIMGVEDDPRQFTVPEYIEGMAGLIRTNIIRGLQGSWQRAAQHLVDAGLIDQYGNVDHDAVAAAEEAAA